MKSLSRQTHIHSVSLSLSLLSFFLPLSSSFSPCPHHLPIHPTSGDAPKTLGNTEGCRASEWPGTGRYLPRLLFLTWMHRLALESIPSKGPHTPDSSTGLAQLSQTAFGDTLVSRCHLVTGFSATLFGLPEGRWIGLQTARACARPWWGWGERASQTVAGQASVDERCRPLAVCVRRELY